MSTRQKDDDYKTSPCVTPFVPGAEIGNKLKKRAEWLKNYTARARFRHIQDDHEDRALVIVFTSQDPNQITDSWNLFAAFQLANDCQFWNLNLHDALTSCQLMGVIYPSSILVGGPRHQLDIIKTAWAKRLLKPPAHFSIDSVGEFPNGLRTRLVEQCNFLLLSEALCYIIYDLAMSGSEIRALKEAPVQNCLDHVETSATLDKNVTPDHLTQIRHKSRVKKSRKSRPKTTDCNPNNLEGITSKLPCEFQIAPNNLPGDGGKVNLEKIYNCLNSWYSGLCLPSRESIQQALDELIASGQVYCTDYGYNVMTIDKLRVAQWVLEQQLGVHEKDLNEHDQRKDNYYTANQGSERVEEKYAIFIEDRNTQNDLKHETIIRPQTENTCVCRSDLTNGGFELFLHSSIPQFRKVERRAETKVNPNIQPKVRLRRHRRVSRRNPEQPCSFCHNYGQLDSLHDNNVIGSPPCPDIVGGDLTNHRLAPKGKTLIHNSTINTSNQDRSLREEQNDQKNEQADWITHPLHNVDHKEQEPSRNENSIYDQLKGKPDNTLTAQTNSNCQTKRPVCKSNPLDLNVIPKDNVWREMASSRLFTNIFDLAEAEEANCDRFRSHTNDYDLFEVHLEPSFGLQHNSEDVCADHYQLRKLVWCDAGYLEENVD
ncbi:storkhead-box protein 1 [Clonorchis sinensis]|uniref:Storkhead-box protein 1 n=1 Tax=Clonorchis sinensis TaxID=79923 RepID=G7YCQ9_CLOSI|nr:storkhead-box protein 1 [Clonorchis sinensis]